MIDDFLSKIIVSIIFLVMLFAAYLLTYEYRKRGELLGAMLDVLAFFTLLLMMVWVQDLQKQFWVPICAVSILGYSITYGKHAMEYYTSKTPIPQNEEEFRQTLVNILNETKNYIENKKGYRLLWNDDGSHKRETDVHILFGDKVGALCKQRNIDMSREAFMGRGPVDFKFSATHAYRACLELKLSSHKKLEHGLRCQLPDYMLPERIKIGIFVVVVFDKKDKEKVNQLLKEKDTLEEEYNISLDIIVIDATQDKKSASVSRRSPVA
ncbi:MAG: hypothetical protein HXS54_06930 [Theionarchaea archaeon]|nr:hypothetical protein [Theionarchaea archaeon]